MQNISRGYASRARFSLPRAIIPLVSAMQKLYCRETRKATAVNDRSRNGSNSSIVQTFTEMMCVQVKLLDDWPVQPCEIQNKESKFLCMYFYGKKKREKTIRNKIKKLNKNYKFSLK